MEQCCAENGKNGTNEIKTIGVIGGMGVQATIDLYDKIVGHTDAACDGEHIHVIIDSNPAIPDRTAAILGRGPSPVPALTESAKRLENAGADFLIMPCNTAHYYYDDICAATKLPVLHMLRLCVLELQKRGFSKVALLATDGTVQSGIYARLFEEHGVAFILPDAQAQRAVMDVIHRGVKAGRRAYDVSALRAELEDMLQAGAEAFVLGCTELPIAFARYGLDYPVIDPTDVLARAAVVKAGYRLV